MQCYESLEERIRTNDIAGLKEAIGNICYIDRNFSSGEFEELIQYVESKGIRLRDEKLTGEPLISSQKSVFTNKDFARAIFEMKGNFCDERIEDVKKIGRALYGAKSSQYTESIPEGKEIQGAVDRTDPNAESHRQKQVSKALIGLVAALAVVLVIVLAFVLVQVLR